MFFRNKSFQLRFLYGFKKLLRYKEFFCVRKSDWYIFSFTCSTRRVQKIRAAKKKQYTIKSFRLLELSKQLGLLNKIIVVRSAEFLILSILDKLCCNAFLFLHFCPHLHFADKEWEDLQEEYLDFCKEKDIQPIKEVHLKELESKTSNKEEFLSKMINEATEIINKDLDELSTRKSKMKEEVNELEEQIEKSNRQLTRLNNSLKKVKNKSVGIKELIEKFPNAINYRLMEWDYRIFSIHLAIHILRKHCLMLKII